MKKGYIYTPKNKTEFYRKWIKIEAFLSLIDNRTIRALLVSTGKSICIGTWEVDVPGTDDYSPVTLMMTGVGLCIDFCIFSPTRQSVSDINGVSHTLAECGYDHKTLMIQFLKDFKKILWDKITNVFCKA
jgi:hypothetical protein